MMAVNPGSRDPDRTELTIFPVNRSQSQVAELTADLGAFANSPRVIEHIVMESDDALAANIGEKPARVVPKTGEDSKLGALFLECDPVGDLTPARRFAANAAK